MDNNQDVLAILKLNELRRDDKMREVRKWYMTEFSPTSVMDKVNLYREGENASANFRMFTSYWDMAASFVLNGGIDEKMFLESTDEPIIIYTKVEPFLDETREVFQESGYLSNLENLCKKMPDFEQKLEGRRRLIKLWNKAE